MPIQIQVLDPQNTILSFDESYTSEDIDAFVLGKFGKNYSWMTEDIILEGEIPESKKVLKARTYIANWRQKFEDEHSENSALKRKIRSLEDRTKQALARQYYLEDVFCGGEVNWRHTKPSTENYKRALNEIGWYEFIEKEEEILSESTPPLVPHEAQEPQDESDPPGPQHI
jgi:hypothetical protein